MRLNNVELTFDEDGKQTRKDNYYPFAQCTKGFFQSQFEKNYYQLYREDYKENFYCVEDERVYFQGTFDNEVEKYKHAYVIVEALKCQDENRNKTIVNGQPVDPPCADAVDIEEWMKYK